VATKVILIIEYDGTGYHGFQLQAKLPTIQGEIERALGELTGERRRVLTASRTDAGVHARGQVVSFRTDSQLAAATFVSGLNHYLPDDIAIRAACRVSDSVNVRRDAVSREYRYYIEAVNEACRVLVGEHDFASFASQMEVGRKGTVKSVYRAGVEREEELVVFDMVANSFLPHQVRNTIGVLLKVGSGRMNTGEVIDIMEARKPGLAGPTVPACGLFLERVNYPVPFEEM
jgi:tRNA pseudouridine38-40 synthase